MLGTVIKGWRRYLSLFSHQEKSIPGGYDSKILSICVPHFTTNLLGLMHLKPIKCFTSRKYIIHAEPMRQLRPFAVPLSKMGSLILPQCLHWVCFSGLATFHPDFHPDAVPSLDPGEPRKLPSRPVGWAHWSFLNHWPFLPQQRSLNWQLPFGVGVASFKERKRRRRNHIPVHQLHARQWTRLIYTFFPNAHCTMFRGQWRIQVEQEASWLWVSVRGELAVLRLLSCPSTQIPTLTISRNLPLSLGGHNRPECAQIKAAWLHNENWVRLPPNYFLPRLSAPRGGCREQMQKSCPDSTLTKITDPLLEPEMPIHRAPQPRPKRCYTNTLLSMLLVSDLLSIGQKWVCLFFQIEKG